MQDSAQKNIHEHLERLESHILNLSHCYTTLHNMICHRRDEVENNITSKIQKLFVLLDSKIRDLKDLETGKMEVIMPPKLLQLTQTMAFIAKRFHEVEKRLANIEADRSKEFIFSIKTKEEDKKEEKLNDSIDNLYLDVRSRNVLMDARIKKIKDLKNFPVKELLKYRSCGKKTINNIDGAIKEYGINLLRD